QWRSAGEGSPGLAQKEPSTGADVAAVTKPASALSAPEPDSVTKPGSAEPVNGTASTVPPDGAKVPITPVPDPKSGKEPPVSPPPSSAEVTPPATNPVPTPSQERREAGRYVSLGSVLLQRRSEAEPWQFVPPESPVFTGDTLVSLPG